MAVDRNQASKDHAAKVRLEAKLKPEIRATRKSLVGEVVRELRASGSLPDVEALSREGVEPVLLDHYARVADAFSGTMSERLPRDLEATPAEVAEISGALAFHFRERAAEQAREIAGTDERNARTSKTIAEEERRRIEEEEKRQVSRAEESLIVGTILGRQLESRLARIAARETQGVAETSKLAEVQVLLDLGDLANLGGPARKEPRTKRPRKKPIKEWVSLGDSSVRVTPFNHLRADSGQVPVDQPFIVGGEKLMHPGDESMGASKKNLMGCRCSSQMDVEEIASSRMDVLEEMAPEEVPEPVPEPKPPGPKEDAKTSAEKWKDDEGNWLPERQRLHDEIVDDFTRGAVSVPEGEERVFQMVAGGTASGKGTVIGTGKVELPLSFVKVDADDIKKAIPEFVEMKAAGDMGAASYVHLESSYLSERIMQRSVDLNAHVVLDGVGDGGVEKIARRINRFKGKGYAVKGDYVTVPTDVALTRVAERAAPGGTDPGRLVPESITRGLHSGVSRDFPEIARADLFDELTLHDTNIPVGQDPRLVFSKVKGEAEVIHDQTLWEAFLAKAGE